MCWVPCLVIGINFMGDRLYIALRGQRQDPAWSMPKIQVHVCSVCVLQYSQKTAYSHSMHVVVEATGLIVSGVCLSLILIAKMKYCMLVYKHNACILHIM